MLVKNLTSSNGKEVPNQFIIETDKGKYFQSYHSIIAFIPSKGRTQLNFRTWDYSTTTGKYRNIFLDETKKETEKKIADGTYELANL